MASQVISFSQRLAQLLRKDSYTVSLTQDTHLQKVSLIQEITSQRNSHTDIDKGVPIADPTTSLSIRQSGGGLIALQDT